MTLAIGLVILAFALVVLEMSFPSFGLLGLGAATAYTFALVYAFGEGSFHGWSLVGAGVILLPIGVSLGLRYLPYSPVGRHLLLKGPSADQIQQGTLPADELRSLIGEVGEALSDLRPSGAARVAGRRIDVVAAGQFIERGEPIVIVEASGARVVVRPAPTL